MPPIAIGPPDQGRIPVMVPGTPADPVCKVDVAAIGLHRHLTDLLTRTERARPDPAKSAHDSSKVLR